MMDDIYDDGPHFDGVGGGQGQSAEDVRESGRAVAWAAYYFVALLSLAWAWGVGSALGLCVSGAAVAAPLGWALARRVLP